MNIYILKFLLIITTNYFKIEKYLPIFERNLII